MDHALVPRDLVIANVTAIVDDELVPGAVVTVADGVIQSVTSGLSPDGALDGAGAYCAPGIVDTHSDGLERELRPRPGVLLPMEFAIHSFEGRVSGAGVTTVFHGVGFENGAKYDRSVEQAHAMTDALAERARSPMALVDHRVLHRLDVRDADGFDALRSAVASSSDVTPLVSYEDHTPGQGQYADRQAMERYVAGTRNLSAAEAATYIDEVIVERDAQRGHRDAAMPWLAEHGRDGSIRLMCHDPAGADDIDEAVRCGAVIAEFPTTVAAAAAARERGLRIVCGAPNALRGVSHSGNVSARELISLGLCDSLASDYLPSTLLGAVGRLVADRVCTLAEAMALITSGPAATVGLDDRGRLAPGYRGDLVLFDLEGALPTVRAVVAQPRRFGVPV